MDEAVDLEMQAVEGGFRPCLSNETFLYVAEEDDHD